MTEIPSSTAERTAIPMDLKLIARKALGEHRGAGGEKNLVKVLSNGSLSLDEIHEVWGITPEQVKGLSPLGVVWDNEVDAEELINIMEFKDKLWKKFFKLLKGTGKSKEDLEKLFEEVYALALRGELDKGKWNDIMGKYDLKDYEMNSSSFSVLLAGEKGFSDETRVESILELNQAIGNLLLTMQLNAPPTGDDEKNEEQVKRYALVFKQYCGWKNFNIVYLDKWEGAADQVLGKINAKLDISKLSRKKLFENIQNGDFGEHLSELADLVENWNEFLVVLLRELENAMAEGIDSNKMDTAQYYLSRSKRMNLVTEILEKGAEGDKERWTALIEELASIFQNKKLAFDYEKVRAGKRAEVKS